MFCDNPKCELHKYPEGGRMEIRMLKPGSTEVAIFSSSEIISYSGSVEVITIQSHTWFDSRDNKCFLCDACYGKRLAVTPPVNPIPRE